MAQLLTRACEFPGGYELDQVGGFDEPPRSGPGQRSTIEHRETLAPSGTAHSGIQAHNLQILRIVVSSDYGGGQL